MKHYLQSTIIFFLLIPASIFCQSVSISDASIAEPADGSSAQIKFDVTLTGATDGPFTVDYSSLAISATPSINTIFVGLDNTTVPIFSIDPINDTSNGEIMGFEAWGMAADPSTTDRIFFNDGSELYEWIIGNPPVLLGDIMFNASTLTVVGLAHYNGNLYASRNINDEAIYEINTTTLEATLFYDYTDGDYDFGGLAVDPNTGIFYGTNDDTDPHGSGVYSIDPVNDQITLLEPYPAGMTDIDGLAYGNGKLYLIIDEPGSIYVYDILNDTYETPLTSPFTTSEIFASGAAFICNVTEDYCDERGTLFFSGNDGETQQVCMTVYGDLIDEPDETFSVTLSNIVLGGQIPVTIGNGEATGTILGSNLPIPTLSEWGMIILTLIFMVIGAAVIRSHVSEKISV
jgi:hypothetical protein